MVTISCACGETHFEVRISLFDIFQCLDINKTNMLLPLYKLNQYVCLIRRQLIEHGMLVFVTPEKSILPFHRDQFICGFLGITAFIFALHIIFVSICPLKLALLTIL